MAFITGITIALFVSLSASFVGLDKDRAFYPTLLAVIASYYCLFAVMDGAVQTILVETLVMVVFLGATVLGFKYNLWIIVVALFVHGLFDLFHAHFIANSGVPVWWSMFCLSYDIIAAAYLAWLLRRSNL